MAAMMGGHAGVTLSLLKFRLNLGSSIAPCACAMISNSGQMPLGSRGWNWITGAAPARPQIAHARPRRAAPGLTCVNCVELFESACITAGLRRLGFALRGSNCGVHDVEREEPVNV